MALVFERNPEGHTVLEETEEGILFGSMLTGDIFKEMRLESIRPDQVLCLVITSIANQIFTVAENVHTELALTMFDEAIKSIKVMREHFIKNKGDFN
jgi:hypothetical protein